MKKVPYLLIALWALQACSSSDDFTKSRVDILARDMGKKENFTIILYDMDVEGSFFSTYKHRYKIITNKEVEKTTGDSTYTMLLPEEQLTDWYEVSETEFDRHVNDMGMEIASKTDGKLSKQTAPPGYSNYVGNERYGQWQQGSDGRSFWHFYGQYAFMSSMMGLIAGPIYRQPYTNYHSNYRNTGKSYYGRAANGQALYGTRSAAVSKSNPSFYSRYNSKGEFRNKVNNSVSRSSSSTSRYGGNSQNSNRSRTSRSQSRSGSSRSRSFSGGGK